MSATIVVAMHHLHAQPCAAAGKPRAVDPGKEKTLCSQAKTGWEFHGNLLLLIAKRQEAGPLIAA
jgi:hypothetical protein